MKKFALLALLVTTTAFAASLSVTGLNTEMVRVLAPFQNDKTVAQVNFQKIETNSEHALSASASVLYRKVGANTLEINIPQISYEYGDGTAPLSRLDGTVKVDLTKMITPDQLSDLLPSLEDVLQGLASSYIRKYGEAVVVEAKLTEKNRDAYGDITSVKGKIKFQVDLTKLPAGVSTADVPFKSGEATVGIEVNTGVIFTARVVSNPASRYFQKDTAGLNEMLERLVAKNPSALEKILKYLEIVDEYAGAMVSER